MAEKTLTINTTLLQLAKIRSALLYAIDLAPTPEIQEELTHAYMSFCNLELDAVEEE